MSDVIYREGTEADYPIIAGMYRKLDDVFRHFGLNMPEPENLEEAYLDSFRRMLGKYTQLYVAEMDGEVVGYILGRIKRTAPFMGGVMVGELADEWIAKKARRLGIADKLCRLLVRWLREQEVHSLEIRILEGNAASWAMLQPMGFQPELTQYRVLWDDYVPAEDEDEFLAQNDHLFTEDDK